MSLKDSVNLSNEGWWFMSHLYHILDAVIHTWKHSDIIDKQTSHTIHSYHKCRSETVCEEYFIRIQIFVRGKEWGVENLQQHQGKHCQNECTDKSNCYNADRLSCIGGTIKVNVRDCWHYQTAHLKNECTLSVIKVPGRSNV